MRYPTARGRIRQPKNGPNKTEQAYMDLLEMRRLADEVLWYAFERIKLKLADRTFYSADFFIMLANMELEVHEVKGFWEDDARVKIKVAAEQFPIFRFIAIKKAPKKDGGWATEQF